MLFSVLSPLSNPIISVFFASISLSVLYIARLVLSNSNLRRDIYYDRLSLSSFNFFSVILVGISIPLIFSSFSFTLYLLTVIVSCSSLIFMLSSFYSCGLHRFSTWSRASLRPRSLPASLWIENISLVVLSLDLAPSSTSLLASRI